MCRGAVEHDGILLSIILLGSACIHEVRWVRTLEPRISVQGAQEQGEGKNG